MIRFGSVCSGIEAASVAWHPLGWRASFLSEIEAFPRAVLAHHYPEVPLHGDFTTIRAGEYDAIDLLVGGTPCQSFSVAGLRGGLDDDRGNLALEYLRLADRLRPRWLVWENVPGVLSSNGGRDFGSILGGMVKLGYGVAYRVLDAQFFGVPQRRRRVFVVGYSGDWRRAAAVLFERHSLQGHPAPSREAAPGVAALTANGVGTCGADDNQAQAGHLIASTGHTAHCLNAGGMGRQDYETETLIAFSAKDHGADAMYNLSPTLRAGGHSGSHANAGVMPAITVALRGREGGATAELGGEVATALRASTGGGDKPHVLYAPDIYSTLSASEGGTMTQILPIVTSAVRRLTPRECERLQGFPDDYTLIPMGKRSKEGEKKELSAFAARTGQSRIKWSADGPRYKALGNSFAVPVVRWIGERIAHVDSLPLEAAA